jgi:hypothetical protein
MDRSPFQILDISICCPPRKIICYLRHSLPHVLNCILMSHAFSFLPFSFSPPTCTISGMFIFGSFGTLPSGSPLTSCIELCTAEFAYTSEFRIDKLPYVLRHIRAIFFRVKYLMYATSSIHRQVNNNSLLGQSLKHMPENAKY